MESLKAPIFPKDPILVPLLSAAVKFPEAATIIYDEVHGFRKSYAELFGDIVQTRQRLQAQLPASTFNHRGVLKEQSKHIAFLTASGYEFIVAFFAIRAIGGVCVPIASELISDESQYYLTKAKIGCLLGEKASMAQAEKIGNYMKTHQDTNFLVLPISSDAEPLPVTDISIDETLEMDPNEPGLVIFTSGTTGLPKGVVLRRSSLAYPWESGPNSASLNIRSGDWLGGTMGLIIPVISGRTLYTLGTKGTPERVLEILKAVRITDLVFMPDLLRDMRDLLTNNTGVLSANDRDKYAPYFSGLDSFRGSTASVEPSLQKFWTELTKLPFTNVYASTELAGRASATSSGIQDSLGKPAPGVSMKLSEGDHGELLVKSPRLFLCYLGDDERTKDAFDEEGYYKTGDMARFQHGEYIFIGRKTSDHILSNFLPISTLAVEQALTDLPYIAEACVLGVPDRAAKDLCGAVVRLRPLTVEAGQINLARIRSDIGDALDEYMMPVLLRILNHGEELPRTVSGKPIKKKILVEYFGGSEWFDSDNMPRGIERCTFQTGGAETTGRNWAQLQQTL